MASASNKELGQAVVEFTLAVGLICAVLVLASRASFAIRQNFKHDFIAPLPHPVDIKLPPNVLFLKGSKLASNIEKLEESNWKFEEKGDGWAVMKKEEKTLILTDKLGVIL